MTAFIVVLIGLAYFAPTFTALIRGARNIPGIIIVNLLLGWTVLGWIGALIWAVLDKG